MSTVLERETRAIGPEQNGLLMSPEEFDAADEWEEGFVYELIHGVLVVNPPPLEQERDPNEELGHWFRSYQEGDPNGSLLNATLSEQYIRTLDSRRRADRVVWVGLGRQPHPRKDVPAIIVEFVSYGRRNWLRDYVEKRDEYLALGVREYWIVNRFQRTLTVFRKTSGGFEQQVVQEDDIYHPALLPGFALPLAQLLRLADRWDNA